MNESQTELTFCFEIKTAAFVMTFDKTFKSTEKFLSEISSFFCSKFTTRLQSIQLVRNKAKGRISKRVFQESKARQNFRKQTFLTL